MSTIHDENVESIVLALAKLALVIALVGLAITISLLRLAP